MPGPSTFNTVDITDPTETTPPCSNVTHIPNNTATTTTTVVPTNTNVNNDTNNAPLQQPSLLPPNINEQAQRHVQQIKQATHDSIDSAILSALNASGSTPASVAIAQTLAATEPTAPNALASASALLASLTPAATPTQETNENTKLKPAEKKKTVPSKAAASNTENKWTKNGFGQLVPKPDKKGGKFTSQESETIKQAIEAYCESKSITPSKLCYESDTGKPCDTCKSPELKGAWVEIAKSLPHRTVQSVYRHGLRQLHPFKRGAWSEEECMKLHELVMEHGKKWSLIQKELHRSADSCRDKYREMDFVKGRWAQEEMSMLVDVIREELRCPAPPGDENEIQIQDLIDHIEKNNVSIAWSDISAKMGNRSRLSCFKKFQKMVKHFNETGNVLCGVGQREVAVEENLLPVVQALSTSSTTEAVPIIQLPSLQDTTNQHTNEAIATIITKENEMQEEYDKNLLQILSSSPKHIYSTDVPWNSIPQNAQNRWIEIISNENYTMRQLPIFELAKYVLDKKIRKEKEVAVTASVVLETMQLPSTKDLLDRIQSAANVVNVGGSEDATSKKRKVGDISTSTVAKF